MIDRKKLDQFTIGYLAALLCSTTDESDESGGEPLDKNYDFEDFDPESFEKCVADCKAFQDKCGEHITEENFTDSLNGESIESQAGYDFWMTRVGHGVGFWEPEWRRPAREILTGAAKEFGEVWPIVGDDGKIYV